MPALEVAMDDAGGEAGIDPVELRLRNIPEKHPDQGHALHSHKLAECLQQGAEAFGWDGAPAQAAPDARGRMVDRHRHGERGARP